MRVLLFCLFLCYVTAELYDHLHYFETLKHVDVKVRKKRSVDGLASGTKDVSFSAFGRDFNLILTPGSPVISGDFKAKIVYRNGQMTPLFVRENDFFTGHLSDDEDIKVDAHVEDGLWTASVYAKDDVYTIEPAWRHLPTSDNHSMIAYRHSDIKWDNIFPELDKSPNKRKKVCGSLHPEDEVDFDREKAREEEEKARQRDERTNSTRYKRAAPDANTCHIIAVADYRFFSGPGGGFPHRTANHIIHTMQKVNNIYRATKWNGDYSGMGFQIKELRIHAEYTDPSDYHDNGRHYNMYDKNITWPDHDLLKQFGEDQYIHKFCLAHLFTHRKFADGVLGLAYIASPRKYAVGGICSYYRRGDRAYNIGFSSTMNTKGDNLLTQEAQLVTAHEFGHNWGSEHDAETSECAPSSFRNGKYIMYPYAVSGYDENNDQFSPCSVRYITAVLTTRAGSCFKAISSNVPLCGNGIVDKDEDCDAGGMGLSGFDPCCSKDCKLIGDAECSPINFECCKDCRMVRPSDERTECRGRRTEFCQEATYCSGDSLDCPQPKKLTDNTPCIDEGRCMNGECLDFCASHTNKKMRPCRCDDDDKSCLRCCKSEDGQCQPLLANGTTAHLPDGRPCNYGYCDGGQCRKPKANMIQRLFTFIEQLDSSTLVAFMKSNIVGTIIVFSLIVWIPASWAVSCIDKRNERKSRDHDLRWVSNEALLNQSLQSNILNNQLADYKVKESSIHHAERPRNYYPSTTERKYKFYNEPDSPVEMETSI